MSDVKELEQTVTCEWWLLCANDANQAMHHPVLGYVPICDRCLEKVETLSAKQ